MTAALYTASDRATCDKRTKEAALTDAEWDKLVARLEQGKNAKTDDLSDREIRAMARICAARLRRVGFFA